MVAIIGVYLSTRLVAGSLDERFTRQLIDTGISVAAGLARLPLQRFALENSGSIRWRRAAHHRERRI